MNVIILNSEICKIWLLKERKFKKPFIVITVSQLKIIVLINEVGKPQHSIFLQDSTMMRTFEEQHLFVQFFKCL